MRIINAKFYGVSDGNPQIETSDFDENSIQSVLPDHVSMFSIESLIGERLVLYNRSKDSVLKILLKFLMDLKVGIDLRIIFV